jgi:hypothetical protein
VPRVLGLLLVLAAAGCSPSSSGGAGTDDADAACIPVNGTYSCLNGTWPVCASGVGPEMPCDDSVHDCMGCAQGAGYTCTCQDSGAQIFDDGSLEGQDASAWFCIGTEATCQ